MSEFVVGDMVDNLASQFASAWDCMRELAQNSMDAGTDRIDVWLEFVEGEGHKGTIAIHVDDFGEGMDEAIIDGQLTRLFSSNKEGDLTKIGKFGIGFVSIFALSPHAVLLQTGRGGEYWEILFDRDKSFTKTRLEYPVEGTQITLFLEGNRARYGECVEAARASLTKWCHHSETEITFEDRSDLERPAEAINQPFEVDGLSLIRQSHPGSEIVMALSADPVYGFYNRGLTLAFGGDPEGVLGDRWSHFRGIALKMKSRYLEHTLSRDGVLRDEQYEKAMELLQAAIPAVHERLGQDLAACVAEADWTSEREALYVELTAHLANVPTDVLMALRGAPLLRTLAGGVVTLEHAWQHQRERGVVLVSDTLDEASRRLMADGATVLLAPPRLTSQDVRTAPLENVLWRYLQERSQRHLKARILRLVGFKPSFGRVSKPAEVYLPVELDSAAPAPWSGLVSRAWERLAAIGRPVGSMTTFTVPGMLNPPLFALAQEIAGLVLRNPAFDADDWPKLTLAVNREHPHAQLIEKQAYLHPDLAEACLVRLVLDEMGAPPSLAGPPAPGGTHVD